MVTQAATADAYGVKHARTGDVVRWEPTSVSFEVDPSVADVTDRAGDAVRAAAGEWSGLAGAPAIRLTDAAAPEEAGYDKRNTIVFKRGGYAPAGRALAITVLTYDDTSGRILDADIVVNGAYTFALPDGHHAPAIGTRSVDTEAIGDAEGEDVAESVHRAFDFQHVIAHELGHSLGLSDEVRLEDALMYRYSAPNMQLRRAPHDDDVAGLEQLYGPAPTSMSASGGGCGGATVSPRDPSRQASTLAFAFAIGLLAFLMLRSGKRRGAAGMALVLSGSAFVLASLPAITRSARGEDVHGATGASLGHATARVLSTKVGVESGLLRTRASLEISTCRVASCPAKGEAAVWGGRAGGVVQIVGSHPLPEAGDDVEIEIAHARAGLQALAPLPSAPSRATMKIVGVR